jgi:hypothetical protein
MKRAQVACTVLTCRSRASVLAVHNRQKGSARKPRIESTREFECSPVVSKKKFSQCAKLSGA